MCFEKTSSEERCGFTVFVFPEIHQFCTKEGKNEDFFILEDGVLVENQWF